MRERPNRPPSFEGEMNLYARAAEERLSINPRDPDALFTRAAFLAGAERPEEAVLALNQVTEVDPDYPGLWRFLARLHSDLGEDRLAGLCLARAGMSG